MKHLRLLLPAGAVALVVAFALGSGGRTTTLRGGADAAGSPDDGYGFTAQDVVVQQSDPGGRLQYEVFAAQVEQRADAAPVVARELTLQYEPREDEIAGAARQWTLRADEGELPEAADQLHLAGNVEVRAQMAGLARPVVLRTDQLTYHTDRHLLKTASRVTFSRDQQQLQATGLEADFQAGTLKLESGVHALDPAAVDISAGSLQVDTAINRVLLKPVEIRQGAMSIRADEAWVNGVEVSFSNTDWHFRGTVHITFEGGELDAGEATAKFVGNQLRNAEVSGMPATFSQPAADGAQGSHGRAGTIHYDVSQARVKLTGDVWFTDGRGELATQAPLTYDLTNRSVSSERVQIRILPEALPQSLRDVAP